MKYKLFGRTGLRVSELCLGTMTFGEDWGWGATKEESRKVFDAYLDSGGNFIDTANLYTNGTSEKYVGEFIKSIREKVVLATKYTFSMNPVDPNAGGNHRKNMIQAVEASLKRMGTEYIDLLWVHVWDFATPVEEVMRGLDDLVRQGKVFYVGVSDTPAWVVSQANTLADLKGWTPFAGLQIQYSLIERTPERELLPMAEALDLAVTPWGIIGGGMLTGKYSKGSSKSTEGNARYDVTDWGDRYRTDRNFAIAEEIERIAKEIGKSRSQVAINWLRQRPRGVIVPILGARRLDQLKDNLGCLKWELSGEHLCALARVSGVELGFPHDFMGSEHVQRILFGETMERLENHRAGRWAVKPTHDKLES